MLKLLSLLFLLLINPLFAYGQSGSFSCSKSLLEKGKAFSLNNAKNLEGQYQFIIVPTWNKEAETSKGQLHLYWEEGYEALQTDTKYCRSQNFPLIGYIKGNFQETTIQNFNALMGQKDPMDPGIRFFPDQNVLEVPGGKVDPSCLECIHICADCPILKFHIKNNVNGTLVGTWTEDLGIVSIENSEGVKINEATGYFCAEPVM